MSLQAKSLDPKSLNPQKPFRASLHSIGKHPVKPWKMPIAPLPRVPPKVYKVDPANFKEFVQKLTGSNQITTTDKRPGHQHRLRTMAPPPLDLVSWSQKLDGEDVRIIPEPKYGSSTAVINRDDHQQTVLSDQTRVDHGESTLLSSSNPVLAGNYLDDFLLNMPPSSPSWRSLLFASAETLSGFEQSAVLAASAQFNPC